ncbi:Piso0_002875 [Millerozyma farinosa CBS 7064]|uniref:Piso0_002875 protein n=1 Tax=Pichia sorbitophila (strain ATCC MYA-4447 / BCRC 22081 / CBS 7064 / NBRC 10061 / NRRL Y-12695) TaxID=559304 RepID=G8YG77_PICSO|nr:Piso0_002875 [Millerozyma farinosa CBS 7064]
MSDKEHEGTDNVALEALRSNTEGKSPLEWSQGIDVQAVTSNPISLSDIAPELTMEQRYLVLQRYEFDKLKSMDDLPLSASFILECVQNLSWEESLEILKEGIITHEADINFPPGLWDYYNKIVSNLEKTSTVQEKLETSLKKEGIRVNVQAHEFSEDEAALHGQEMVDWKFEARIEASKIAFWSPYPEVRAITDPYDDPNERCETFRSYFISIIWQGIATFVNTYFKARQPAISLSSEVVQVLIYPCGILWAYAVPNWTIGFTKKWKIELNPGPWTAKEQMFATLIYSVAGGANFLYQAVVIQRSKEFFYNSWADWGYEILLGFSLTCLGLGMAGLLRVFFVHPYEQIWPFIIPNVAVNKALMAPEKKEIINGWRISRYKFFFVCFMISFLYFWFPDYIFTAISSFSWLTWIKPDNLHLDNVCGFNGGIGLNPITTFDFNVMWAQIQPLVLPAYNTILMYFGTILLAFTSLGLYYSNYKWTSYMPLNSNALFDNTGAAYNVSMILTADNKLNKTAIQHYSLPYYSAWNLVSTGASYATLPFLVLYVTFEYWKPMVKSAKKLKQSLFGRTSLASQFKDPFCRMNAVYKEAPEWWFLIVFLASLALAIGCFRGYPTDTPVWTLFFALGFNIVVLFPIIQFLATTGSLIVLNGITELVGGYALPGHLLTYVLMDLYGTYIPEQCQNYLSNQKSAHYTKVPPRSMFRGQLFTSLINCVVSVAIINWQMDKEGMCSPENPDKFTCPTSRSIFSSSVLLGLIGPKIVFSQLYPILKWCFLIGFLLVIPAALFKMYGPRSLTAKFEPTLILYGLKSAPPYNLSYYTPGLYWAIGFMFYLKNYYTAWWMKYNYLFYSGISAGIALSSIVIYFAVQYNPKPLNWWGNTVTSKGYDGIGGGPLKNASLAEGGYFGPRYGHFG